MPHMMLDLSRNIATQIDLEAFCQVLHREMVACEIFPLAGIRVRAHIADVALIADQDPRNGFIHMELRIGAGRDLAAKEQAGRRIFAAANAFLAPLFTTPYFALSFDITEIDPVLTWKTNPIHPRLNHKG